MFIVHCSDYIAVQDSPVISIQVSNSSGKLAVPVMLSFSGVSVTLSLYYEYSCRYNTQLAKIYV